MNTHKNYDAQPPIVLFQEFSVEFAITLVGTQRWFESYM